MKRSKNAVEFNIGTDLDYLNLIESITNYVTKAMGFDEDTMYWINMAIRESMTNAMLHGNKLKTQKRVNVKFEINPDNLTVRVQDQGSGFDPKTVPNPLDPENVLKSSGRGIFYIKSFMDEVDFKLLPDGMEIRMTKKVPSK